VRRTDLAQFVRDLDAIFAVDLIQFDDHVERLAPLSFSSGFAFARYVLRNGVGHLLEVCRSEDRS
jgi:hypothetical protein